MTQKETNKKIDDIGKWVKAGHSQSPQNCRILLSEINRLRALVNERNDG